MSKWSMSFAPIFLFCSCLTNVAGCGSASLRPVIPTASCTGLAVTDGPKGECVQRRNKLIERSIASTVRIDSKVDAFLGNTGTGTGVVIEDGLYVLTAYHVLSGYDLYDVTPRRAIFRSSDEVTIVEQQSVPAIMVKFSEKKDAALLARKDGGRFMGSVKIAPRGYRTTYGDRLWHFGQSTGIAFGVDGEDRDERTSPTGRISFLGKVKKGDSGGPVMTADALLVGIASTKMDDEDIMHFVPIHAALDALGVREQ